MRVCSYHGCAVRSDSVVLYHVVGDFYAHFCLVHANHLVRCYGGYSPLLDFLVSMSGSGFAHHCRMRRFVLDEVGLMLGSFDAE